MKLKKESKDMLKKYADMNILSASHICKIWQAENSEDMIEAFYCLLKIDEQKIMRIWDHIINKVWIGIREESDKDTVFNEYESIFIRELLRNKGILTRNQCIKKIFKTSYLSDSTAESLIEVGIIDSFKMSSWEVLYVLNLKFYKEVFKDEV